MSKLNDLINQLCPDGVQYKKLGEIAKIKRGRRLTRKQLSGIELPGTFPVFHGGIQPIGYYSEKNRQANTVMITNVGASAGTVLFSEKDFWSSDGCFCLLELKALNPRFAYYYVKEHEQKLKQRVRVAGIPTLDADVLKRFEIPLPPLPVQEEIVRILDSFTTLEAELEAELADRKKQYEYYRDYLLDKNTLEKIDGTAVETKKLGEVCNYVKNKVDMADVLPENYTSVENLIKNCGGRMNAISIPKDGKCTDVMIGDILLGNIRPNLRKAWLATCAGGASNDVLVIRIKDGVNLNARYLYQIIAGNDFSCYNIQHMRGAKMPRGDKSKILDYKLPVPSLATQERIVDILDRFDALTTSLTDGIPAEIAMRREQYEYCRSRLLDFPRLSDSSVSDGDDE